MAQVSRKKVPRNLNNNADRYLLRRWYWCREFDRTNGHIAPEKRLIPATIGALCLPICLFWFAWSSGRTHWMAPVVSTAIFGVGASCLFNPIINYLTDSYPTDAASVLASVSNSLCLLLECPANDASATTERLHQECLRCRNAPRRSRAVRQPQGRLGYLVAWIRVPALLAFAFRPLLRELAGD